MEQGNFSNVKGVGAGVYEYRISFGPDYRIYFGKDGDRLVILLAGGTRKRQDADIKVAQVYWKDYKRRTRKEPLAKGSASFPARLIGDVTELFRTCRNKMSIKERLPIKRIIIAIDIMMLAEIP